MPRVRIDKKAYEKFTGQMGDVDFVDGVSVESVSKAEARRLGSFITIVEVDTEKQVGFGQEIIDINGRSADQVTQPSETYKEKPKVKSEKPKVLKEKPPKKEKPKAKQKESSLDYTEATLAALADDKGINGLREYAKQYDVYGRSIVEIIGKMMQLKNHSNA